MKKYVSISELSKELNLVNSTTKKPLNYVLRFWEQKFRQIKPKIINKRRYYSLEQVQLIKLINFLLKNKGLTINGVKNLLNSNINKLDDYNSHSLKTDYFKKNLKEKSFKVLEKIKRLKKYGKKNTH